MRDDFNDDTLMDTWEGDISVGHLVAKTYETHKTGQLGHTLIGYQLFVNDKMLFEGDDFAVSRYDTIDGRAAMHGMLRWFTLKPGDTDHEFFDGYTPEQLEFVTDNGDELAMLLTKVFGDE